MGPELVLTIKTPVAPSLVAVCPSGGGAQLAIGKATGHVRRQGTFLWHVLQGQLHMLWQVWRNINGKLNGP